MSRYEPSNKPDLSILSLSDIGEDISFQPANSSFPIVLQARRFAGVPVL